MTQPKGVPLRGLVVAGFLGVVPFVPAEVLLRTSAQLPSLQSFWPATYAVRNVLGPGMLIGLPLHLLVPPGEMDEMYRAVDACANAAVYAGCWFVFRTRGDRPKWQCRSIVAGAVLWIAFAAFGSVVGVSHMGP